MIQGEIQTFPLPDLIQWLALTRRTGMLVVAQGADRVERYLAEQRGPAAAVSQTAPRGSAQLHFIAGEIAAASMSELAILDSAEKVCTMLSTALAWRAGRFVFSANPPPEWVLTKNLRLSAEALLIEAAQTNQDGKLESDSNSGGLAAVKEHSEGFMIADALRLHVVDRLLKEDFSVPAMPQLAVRVLELTRDENFSLRALEKLVQTDQAVTARILRYANSVLVGSERRVDSLGLAIQRLGTDEVVNVILAASLQAHRLGKDLFAAEKSRLSLHSLVAGFLARTITTRVSLNSQLGFLCGLLMDFGMTVLYSVIQQTLTQRAKPEPVPTRIIEEIVRDYHPRVGGAVGEKWQLPAPVIETMAHHHCLDEVVNDDKPYVAIAALADALTTFVLGTSRAGLEESLARFQPERLLAHRAAQFLGLSLDDASAVLKDLPRSLDQALEFMAK